MPASTIDQIIAQRSGVLGKITVQDILDLVPPSSDASAAFLPAPDRRDEADATYFYFGWASVGGDWLIQRQERATGGSVNASTGAADFAAAWDGRAGLTYS